MELKTRPEPCIVIIFGASGDLTSRKLMPALHNLRHDDLIPPATSVVGISRTQYGDEDFRNEMRSALQEHSRITPTQTSWKRFAKDLFYVPGDFTGTDLWPGLKQKLDEIDAAAGTKGNRVWYL
ncbi:MAG: glucose-6-phosphate dehydrogenase, partial [Actinomycetota bacterium]